jgi:hypothetical protein
MKYIITESQYNRIAQSTNRLWILRRYNLIKQTSIEVLKYVNPCDFGNFDDYESVFYNHLMDDIHQEYYLIDNFDYAGVVKELEELFYVDITETYYDRKQRCI